jgi:hypothetical protein
VKEMRTTWQSGGPGERRKEKQGSNEKGGECFEKGMTDSVKYC